LVTSALSPGRVDLAPEPPVSDELPTEVADSAESEYIAEARARGEPVAARKPSQTVDEPDPKTLPPLDELVQRIPPEVRVILEELYRAKFLNVRRLPKAALKTQAG
jgi:hypothetical protein